MFEETDPREDKLPQWAQTMIDGLRTQLRTATTVEESLYAENDRLRTVIDGKFSGETSADTFYVNDDTASQIPLGTGVTVRFGGFADVTVQENTLLVDTDAPVVIRPGTFNHQILITQDDK